MPYLRLTADRRGNEHTFLMHVAAPGEPARVLYWYRTAPGVRLGRPALDDAAMRWLEDQYPGIDFDWRDILESAALTPVEVEAPLPPRKRKVRPADTESLEVAAEAIEPNPDAVAEDAVPGTDARDEATEPTRTVQSSEPDLLADLMGRGIASSVRRRYAEQWAAVAAAPVEDDVRTRWQGRLAAVDPADWRSPEAVLAGMAAFDAELTAVQRDLAELGPPAETGPAGS